MKKSKVQDDNCFDIAGDEEVERIEELSKDAETVEVLGVGSLTDENQTLLGFRFIFIDNDDYRYRWNISVDALKKVIKTIEEHVKENRTFNA